MRHRKATSGPVLSLHEFAKLQNILRGGAAENRFCLRGRVGCVLGRAGLHRDDPAQQLVRIRPGRNDHKLTGLQRPVLGAVGVARAVRLEFHGAVKQRPRRGGCARRVEQLALRIEAQQGICLGGKLCPAVRKARAVIAAGNALRRAVRPAAASSVPEARGGDSSPCGSVSSRRAAADGSEQRRSAVCLPTELRCAMPSLRSSTSRSVCCSRGEAALRRAYSMTSRSTFASVPAVRRVNKRFMRSPPFSAFIITGGLRLSRIADFSRKVGRESIDIYGPAVYHTGTGKASAVKC